MNRTNYLPDDHPQKLAERAQADRLHAKRMGEPALVVEATPAAPIIKAKRKKAKAVNIQM